MTSPSKNGTGNDSVVAEDSAARHGVPWYVDAEVHVVLCLTSVLAVVGACGNVVVLNVFCRRSKRDRACPGVSATIYVLALAAADLMTCVVVMPSTVYMEYVHYHLNSDFVCKLYYFMITSNIPFSSLIMVAIAVDRYICICHPLQQATLATARRARVVVGFLAVVASALGICVALMFGVYHRLDVPAGSSRVVDTEVANSSLSSMQSAEQWPTIADDTANASAIFGDRLTLFRRDSFQRSKTYERVETTETSRPGDATADFRPKTYGGLAMSLDVSGTKTDNLGSPLSTTQTVFVLADVDTDADSSTLPIVNTGLCADNDLILGQNFKTFYVTFHSAMYPVCLVVVFVLYALIYRSVVIRRARRMRLRCPASPRWAPEATDQQLEGRHQPVGAWIQSSAIGLRKLVTSSRGGNQPTGAGTRERLPVAVDDPVVAEVPDTTASQRTLSSSSRNGISVLPGTSRANLNAEVSGVGIDDDVAQGTQSISTCSRATARYLDHHRTLLAANLRTAAMLFVVTVVFVLSYTPAFLMSVELVPYSMLLFYLYFVNCVANPVIYSFMNHYFRQELRSIICRPIDSYRRNNASLTANVGERTPC